MDAYLNGEVWEFKVPEGWNDEWTVKDQFFKARDKGTGKLLISATKNGASVEDMSEMVAGIFRSGDYPYIDEVLLMG